VISLCEPEVSLIGRSQKTKTPGAAAI
jgi:hypothetical protein